MSIRLAILSPIFAALIGCQASLTIFSQPEGAYLTEPETGTAYGVAPAIVFYDSKALSNYKRADGCYYVKSIEAHWVSGAIKNSGPIRLRGPSDGSYNMTIPRPSAYPDLDRDLQFALQLQSIRAQQQQAYAAQQAAAALLYRALNPPQSNSLTNCVSTPFGNSVHTNCNSFGF